MKAAAIALLAAALSCGAAARAQTATESDAEKQRSALYAEGLDFAQSGDWASAADRFRRVVAIRSSPKALFTLGQAEEKLGQLATAQRTYEKALADAKAVDEHAVVEAAEQALREIDPRVPRIVLRLDAQAAQKHAFDAHATIDGVPAPIGETIAIDPGEHEVRAQAPGTRPYAKKLHVEEGGDASRVVMLDLIEISNPIEIPPPPTPENKSSSIAGPLVLGGVGLAAGVVGFIVRSGGQSDYDAAASQCPSDSCPTSTLRDAGNAARRRIVIGTIVMSAGAAAIAGAGAWWLLLDSSRERTMVALRVSF